MELVPLPDVTVKPKVSDGGKQESERDAINGNTSSIFPTTELHTEKEMKCRFLRTIATKVARAYERKYFRQLIIVAPPLMLDELRIFLGFDMMQYIIAEVPEELTHCNNHQLQDHLKQVLSRAHAA